MWTRPGQDRQELRRGQRLQLPPPLMFTGITNFCEAWTLRKNPAPRKSSFMKTSRMAVAKLPFCFLIASRSWCRVWAFPVGQSFTLQSGQPVRESLFHGDSITQGTGTTHGRNTYSWVTCEEVGCEPINLGFGGSAWGDQVVAEYIASRNDWDVLVVAYGTNTYRRAHENPEQFAANLRYFPDHNSGRTPPMRRFFASRHCGASKTRRTKKTRPAIPTNSIGKELRRWCCAARVPILTCTC